MHDRNDSLEVMKLRQRLGHRPHNYLSFCISRNLYPNILLSRVLKKTIMFLVTECLKTLRMNNCPQEKGGCPYLNKPRIKRNLIRMLNKENGNLLSRLKLPAGSFFWECIFKKWCNIALLLWGINQMTSRLTNRHWIGRQTGHDGIIKVYQLKSCLFAKIS